MTVINERNTAGFRRVFYVVVLILFGCSKDSEEFDSVLLAGTEYMEVSNKEASYSFDLLSSLAYSVSTDVDWIILTEPEGGKGKKKVSFTVSENTQEERSGVILVHISEQLNREVLVVQEAGTLSVFYVKPEGDGDGRSWETASSFDVALSLATSGSEIHLSEGIYVPTKSISGGDVAEDADRTFEINRNIKIVGGYPADATENSMPDPLRYRTIFTGNLPSGAEAFHVVAVTAPKAEQEQVEIQGIIIQEGNGSDRNTKIKVGGKEISRGHGAGVVISGARVLLRNVTIANNKTSNVRGVSGYAAGIYAQMGSELHIYDSHVDNNRSDANGGGLWVDESIAYIFNSTFDNNDARGTAAGVHAFPNAAIYMYNSSVSGNRATSYGAGVYARGGSKAFLINCLVNLNTSTSPNGGGGVMLYDNCEAHIISSTISKNSISGPGGGVFRRQNANKLTVINSIISGNIQVNGSSDVDVYELDAPVAVFRASVIGRNTYDPNNSVINGAQFNADNMLNERFFPIGDENPALKYGMNASSLAGYGERYTPALSEHIKEDFNGVLRSTYTTMGAIVE